MIEQLKEQIIKANDAYRLGNPIISDKEYDLLVDELSLLSPTDELLTKVGHSFSDESRKSKLPIEMASMNKIKSMDDINDWCRLKGISKNEVVIITPKFDGLSLCVNELTDDAFTRGNGEYGQKSNEHYKLIDNHLYDIDDEMDVFAPIDCEFTYGEVMMSKKTFTDKYSSDFANPRNLVAGLLNSKEATQSLKDCDYIKYGAIFTPDLMKMRYTKQEVIDYLNQYQKVKVQYHVCKISEITEELLISLFKEYSIDYEIDGLIIEINNLSLQYTLGRETSSNNPCYARAFKHPSFEQSAETEVIGISWNISKQGLLKPILHISPVKLDGVTVSNVTGNNARFVKDMGIGVGAKVVVKRSGMVIPIIADVVQTVEFQMPNVENIDWNENGVELMTLTETDDQKLKKNISFFEILEADNVSEGVITQLWDAGYKTISDILNLTTSDLEKIDRFGKRKAKIVFDSIQKSVTNVSLPKLQHATGIFKNMGSKKLLLLESFTTKPTIEQVLGIEGIGDVLAKEYINKYDQFFDFIKDLPITFSEKIEVVSVGNKFEDKQFVFTGVRLPEYEKIIIQNGGKISSGVSKNTTHLVMKLKGSGSSKEKKAIELGIEILDVSELEEQLKSI
jgi:NAD-dependent DNA ligase